MYSTLPGIVLRHPFCADKAECWNAHGSSQCVCNSGYAGDGLVCEEQDECRLTYDELYPPEPVMEDSSNTSNTSAAIPSTTPSPFSGDLVLPPVRILAPVCKLCTFDEGSGIEYEYPAASLFVDCWYACMNFASLKCTALEFEPDDKAKLFLEDTDSGKCFMNTRSDSTVSIRKHPSRRVYMPYLAPRARLEELYILPVSKRVSETLLKYRSSCDVANGICVNTPGSHTCSCNTTNMTTGLSGRECLPFGSVGTYEEDEACPDDAISPGAESATRGECSCPAGHIPAGNWSLGNWTAEERCVPCPAGTWAPANATECTPCWENTWTLPGGKVDRYCLCDRGFYWDWAGYGMAQSAARRRGLAIECTILVIADGPGNCTTVAGFEICENECSTNATTGVQQCVRNETRYGTDCPDYVQGSCDYPLGSSQLPCTRCPEHSTSFAGSESITDCVCEEGYVKKADPGDDEHFKCVPEDVCAKAVTSPCHESSVCRSNVETSDFQCQCDPSLGFSDTPLEGGFCFKMWYFDDTVNLETDVSAIMPSAYLLVDSIQLTSTADLKQLANASRSTSFKDEQNLIVSYSGTLDIEETGFFEVCVASSELAGIYIDGLSVVRNLGNLGIPRTCAETDLAAGEHEVVLKYVHAGSQARAFVEYAKLGQGTPAFEILTSVSPGWCSGTFDTRTRCYGNIPTKACDILMGDGTVGGGVVPSWNITVTLDSPLPVGQHLDIELRGFKQDSPKTFAFDRITRIVDASLPSRVPAPNPDYESFGCFKDNMTARALGGGTCGNFYDSLGVVASIDMCARIASGLGLRGFCISEGAQCLSSRDFFLEYDKYNASTDLYALFLETKANFTERVAQEELECRAANITVNASDGNSSNVDPCESTEVFSFNVSGTEGCLVDGMGGRDAMSCYRLTQRPKFAGGISPLVKCGRCAEWIPDKEVLRFTAEEAISAGSRVTISFGSDSLALTAPTIGVAANTKSIALNHSNDGRNVGERQKHRAICTSPAIPPSTVPASTSCMPSAADATFTAADGSVALKVSQGALGSESVVKVEMEQFDSSKTAVVWGQEVAGPVVRIQPSPDTTFNGGVNVKVPVYTAMAAWYQPIVTAKELEALGGRRRLRRENPPGNYKR
jgi:hypothetical protein